MKHRDTDAFKELDAAIHDWALEHRELLGVRLGRFSTELAEFAYGQFIGVDADDEADAVSCAHCTNEAADERFDEHGDPLCETCWEQYPICDVCGGRVARVRYVKTEPDDGIQVCERCRQ